MSIKNLKSLFFVALALFAFGMLAGCGDKSNSTAFGVTNPDPNPFNPKGTVNGVLRDTITNTPISGATIVITAGAQAVTGPNGEFTIYGVPANTAVGNEPANATAADAYPVVIDMTNVNAQIKAYNTANPATPKAFYPEKSFTAVTVKYDSLGETSGPATTQTNHDTPVDGFVASIMPTVGKLDAKLVVQFVKASDFAPVDQTVVKLISVGSANNATGNTSNVVATATTGPDGIATFNNVEAGQFFNVSAAVGSLAYVAGSAPQAGGVDVQAPADNQTRSYLLSGPNTAFKMGTVDITAPKVISTTPANLADVAAGTTTVSFKFSEPIKANNYANAVSANLAANGGIYKDVYVNYDGPKAGNVAYALAWSTDMTTLNVTFTSGATSKYTVAIQKPAAGVGLVDANGLEVTYPTTVGATAAAGKVTFSTSGGLAVTAPTVTRVAKTNTINWVPTVNAFSYNIYLQKVVAGVAEGIQLDTVDSPTSVTQVDLTAAITVLGGFSVGQTNITYNVFVTAVNTEGTESAQSAALVIDDQTVATYVGAAPVFPLTFNGSVGLSLIDAALTKANGTKSFKQTFTFNTQMDMASVKNLANWSTGKAAATNPGGAFVAGPDATKDTVPAIAGVDYDPTTKTATVTFTYTQNGTIDATTDPGHTVFTFSGKSLNSIATTINWDGAGGVFPTP